MLRAAIREHGEVVTQSKDDLPPAVQENAQQLPADALVVPLAPVPTVESSGSDRKSLRKVAQTVGEVVADTPDAVYIRTSSGAHLRLVSHSPTVVYDSDGVRVNLANMVIDPVDVTDSQPYSKRLDLTARDRDLLAGDASASLRGLASTAGRITGIEHETMSTIRSNSSLVSTISDHDRHNAWIDISNGDRPDRALANLRLAGFEHAIPGLEKANTAEFRRGMRTLATTMRKANVSPTMRAEMSAAYLAAQEPNERARHKIVARLLESPDSRYRALFYADTGADSFPTDLRDVAVVASHAHSLGTTVRERCYVANALRVSGAGDLLKSASKIGVEDGLARPVVSDRVLSGTAGMGRVPLPRRRVAMDAAQAHNDLRTPQQGRAWLKAHGGKRLMGYVRAHTRLFGMWRPRK